MDGVSADFLLELRSEEIPARMQARASADLARLFAEELAKSGIVAGEIQSFATPRRLALIARGLPLETQATAEERKGPRADAPEQAIAGFLKSTGLTRDQLVERADAKGHGVLFAVIEKPGRATADVIAEAVPAIIRAFPWPKSMRWGDASQSSESLRWVRPLQGIVALLGDAVVPFEIAGVASGNETVGHRFHAPGRIAITDAASYADQLRAAHVIVDSEERQSIIALGATTAAAQAGLVLVRDDGLLAENAGLTEWPVPLLGGFDPAFLAVPPEVIQLTMRTNQKYFACQDSAGNLAPNFICVSNIVASDGGASIVAGNRKVLAARLSDAQFFWEQDKKIPLARQAEKLSQIVFHEKLGTVADKVERVAKLARWLVEEGIVGTPDQADLAEQAARLCKADLVTGMVGEFPELQGVMGGYYARAEGLPDAVADAIRDHYKPAGQGDDVPTAPVTVAVSLADKLDSIVQFFQQDMKPSGSKDPFALRRSALGAISLILTSKLRFSLDRAVAIGSPSRPPLAVTALFGLPEVVDFFADRLKVQQREAGVRHDLIDAVFALGGEDDLVRLLARVHALQAFIETDDGTNLLAGYKRATNILKKEGVENAAWSAPAYPPEPAEAALIAALDDAEPRAAAAVAAEDFGGAMAALAMLRAPIDAFFEAVTVNDADAAKRGARLALLVRIRDAVHQVADFSRIEK
ncbi:glycine--tRNA ligase subunit beta [uncultured Sphingomonas sp.]|uniref:glycine--tRNA ligase subunit beta n=1 Tax=uncultured Sphingomonas sp. TaxID=158754 RepID=UPI00260ED359|nr:glycine--tRNA ligase subunit beta [uncultured Sphingomonas sp.]